MARNKPTYGRRAGYRVSSFRGVMARNSADVSVPVASVDPEDSLVESFIFLQFPCLPIDDLFRGNILCFIYDIY